MVQWILIKGKVGKLDNDLNLIILFKIFAHPTMETISQRQAENDQRFNILLEEVRFLIRGNKDDQSL
ncbi:MAG: hypothetical protein QNJ37_13640 [Crocosphaera sp.]|nr:hypothetical protein [Crocosphaera sp.]